MWAIWFIPLALVLSAGPAEIPEASLGLLSLLDDLSERVLVDRLSRPDRNDFDTTFSRPVDDASSADWQAPIAFKLFFKRFTAGWVVKDVCQRGAHLAL